LKRNAELTADFCLAPYRQLVPFSPFDPSLSDANVLDYREVGCGKTFMVQMFLTMMAALNRSSRFWIRAFAIPPPLLAGTDERSTAVVASRRMECC